MEIILLMSVFTQGFLHALRNREWRLTKTKFIHFLSIFLKLSLEIGHVKSGRYFGGNVTLLDERSRKVSVSRHWLLRTILIGSVLHTSFGVVKKFTERNYRPLF